MKTNSQSEKVNNSPVLMTPQSSVKFSIADHINNYLLSNNTTRSAFAKSLNLSKGFISDILSKRRVPSVDTIIQICAHIDINDGETLRLVSDRTSSKNKRYEEWNSTVNKKNDVIKVSDEVSLRLARDLDLLNAFTDIWYSKDGLKVGELVERYGKSIIDKLSYLVGNEIVKRVESRFFIIEKNYHGFTPRSAFRFMHLMIENEESQFDERENIGRTRYNYADLGDDGQKWLYNKVVRDEDEFKEAVDKYTLPVSEGGKRMAYLSAATCILKCLPVVLMLLVFNRNELLAIGPGGGGSDAGGVDPRVLSIGVPVTDFDKFFAKNNSEHKNLVAPPTENKVKTPLKTSKNSEKIDTFKKVISLIKK